VSPSTARGPAASRSPPHLAHQGRPAPAQQREQGAGASTATPPARSSRIGYARRLPIPPTRPGAPHARTRRRSWTLSSRSLKSLARSVRCVSFVGRTPPLPISHGPSARCAPAHETNPALAHDVCLRPDARLPS
jgi:hypothetical protein